MTDGEEAPPPTEPAALRTEPAPPRTLSQGRIALAIGLAAIVVAVAVVLAGSPVRVVRVGAHPEQTLGSTATATTVCQRGETLPAAVSAIRIGLEGPIGPPVLLRAYSGGHVISQGNRTANWTGASVTIPVTPLKSSSHPVTLCFSVSQNSELIKLYGPSTPEREAAHTSGGQALAGRFSVEYLAPGEDSWWSKALAVARRMGVGHALGGTWLALLVALLVAALTTLFVRLAWRELS